MSEDTAFWSVCVALVIGAVVGFWNLNDHFNEAEPAKCTEFAEEHVGAARAFIVDCARAANPLSDEAGEDLVRQCEATALSLYRSPGPCARIRSDLQVWRCDAEGLPEAVAIACGMAERGPE